jgi:uncharacterized membrane protein
MLCVSASIRVQNTKQLYFLIHAGSVYAICVLKFLYLFLSPDSTNPKISVAFNVT